MTQSRYSRTSRSTSTTSTIMPTRNESNGSGPLDPDLRSRSVASPEPKAVTKGGPFDLSEMQRLANEMFRALPGALLPGLDPDQLDSVAPLADAESLRPPPGALPTPNGHVTSGPGAMRDLSAGQGGVTRLSREAVDVAAPEQWSYLLDVARPEPSGPAPPPPTGGGLLALSGDPMSLSELGLAGVPRGALEDPFDGSYYFLEEAARLTEAREPVEAVVEQSVAGAAPREPAHPAFDVYSLRGDFPVLAERVHGRPLVWLDNGATTQKPVAVIERLDHFCRHENSNIHRAAHELAARATDCLRRCAGEDGTFPARPLQRRDRVRARHHRGDQPGRPGMGPRERRPWRRDPDHVARASRQHRSLAAALPGHRRSPVRFEAGTTSIADAVGLGAALAYVQRIGMENIARHEHELLAYATAALAGIPGLQLIGTAAKKAAVLSFLLDGFTPEEVGEALDREGIAVRAGHHCAQPIMRRFGHEGTVRVSLAFYNTCGDIDALIAALPDRHPQRRAPQPHRPPIQRRGRVNGHGGAAPLTRQKVKSAFELGFGATLPNEPQILTGRSWWARAPIRRVDISTDGGSSWRVARLRSPNLPRAWVRWDFPWRPAGPGNHTLLARATDRTGQTQPPTVLFNTLGYLFWAIVEHQVTVSN